MPKYNIHYKGESLQRVNEYTYLGVTLSSQMSFSSHLRSVVTKANARIVLLYARLDLQKMPLEVLLKVFQCYILPIFEYGLVLWITGNFSTATEELVNATFTKFLKRYLKLPLYTQNALIHQLSDTVPLMSYLRMRCINATKALCFPDCMNGIKLTLFDKLPEANDKIGEDNWKLVPSFFWRSRAIHKIPSDQKFRKKLCREVCETDHFEHCKTTSFHSVFSSECICKYCNNHLHAYHVTYSFCKLHSNS